MLTPLLSRSVMVEGGTLEHHFGIKKKDTGHNDLPNGLGRFVVAALLSRLVLLTPHLCLGLDAGH
jgi:hypothetical protein